MARSCAAARRIIRGGIPGAKDTSCVIEVADSSLRRDRTTKLRIYASAGIGQSVIVNLIDQVVEAHGNPVRGKAKYGKASVVNQRQSIEFPFPGGRTLSVAAKQISGE